MIQMNQQTARHNTEGEGRVKTLHERLSPAKEVKPVNGKDLASFRKEIDMIGDEGYIFCDDREQRVSKAVCQANVKKGTCKKDLLKCRKTRTPKPTEELTPAPRSWKEAEKALEENLTFEDRKAEAMQLLTGQTTPNNGQLDLFGERNVK